MKERGCFSWGLIVFGLLSAGAILPMAIVEVLFGEEFFDRNQNTMGMVVYLTAFLFVFCGVYYIKRRDEAREEEEDEDEVLENEETELPVEVEVGENDICFVVRGTYYRDKDAQVAAWKLKTGDEILLIKEPTNQYDPYAVKVCTKSGFHIGYVPSELSEEVTENMHEDKDVATVRFVYSGDSIPSVHAVYHKKGMQQSIPMEQ